MKCINCEDEETQEHLHPFGLGETCEALKCFKCGETYMTTEQMEVYRKLKGMRE